ncbi:MAG: cyanophycinase [Bacteroidota bacterium]
MKQIFAILLLFFSVAPHFSSAQAYTYWSVGDTADVMANAQPGLLLAGGGGDNDDAMTWFLQHSGGGDIVVIRASGSDGYNSYLFGSLGVTVNSVETIRFDAAAAANDPWVIAKIRNAEGLFIAGGDQYDYYQYWRNTPIENAINYLIDVKGVPVGGTSAGMAILGEVYYTPSGGSVDSAEALGNPYHPDMDIIGRDDFLLHPWMDNTITDTHFDDRDRAGRTMAFLARMETDWGIDAFAIACNEYTAVAVDSTGLARVFGETPNYPDYAYFMQSNCDVPGSVPETCSSGTPLHWERGQEAVKVYKVGGTETGANTFSLVDWETGSGGEWQDWYVMNGTLMRNFNAAALCLGTSVEGEWKEEVVFPTVFGDGLTADFTVRFGQKMHGVLEVWDLTGRKMHGRNLEGQEETTVEAGDWAKGMYVVRWRAEEGKWKSQRVIKQ